MLKYLLVAAGLALMAFGGHGLYQATLNPPAPGAPDVLVYSLALGAGLAVLVATLWLLRPAPPPLESSDEDRAEVIERLQRHTEALRAETQEGSERRQGKDPAKNGGGEKRSAEGGISLPAIMLLRVGPEAGLEQIESAPPLGTRAEVLARLRDVLPDVEFGADGRGTHTGPDHTVTFDAGLDDVVHTLVVDAAGQTGVSMVRWLMEGTGWRGFVPKRGSFVDPEQLEELIVRQVAH
jgi:hypothetical protein